MFTFVETYIFDLLENVSLKIDLITYCSKIHGNIRELNF
jgi:tRNA A37 threonylcarbamoyladenosine dehydratase